MSIDIMILIDINSIRFLKTKGWKINYLKEKELKTKEILKSSKKSIVSILGHSNRGKTYILQKLSGVNFQIQTKGLSIKIPEDQNYLLLDTQGTNAPLLLEEDEEDKRNDQNFIEVLENINLCQIITNYLIQTFIIKELIL
jgi:translation initiation factor RLI1